MSLSSRDTFVRYVDPLATIWEDADGNHHFSVANALKAFKLEDTPENRAMLTNSYESAILENNPQAIIVHRDHPDHPDYWKTVHPEDRPAEFRHLPYEQP